MQPLSYEPMCAVASGAYGMIRPQKPVIVGFDAAGKMIEYDDENSPQHFGQRYQQPDMQQIRWRARCTAKNLNRAEQITIHNTGLILSPRLRQVVEEHDITNVEFIPLDIYHEKSGEQLADDWWALNCFNWKAVDDVFDLSSAELIWKDWGDPDDKVRWKFGLSPRSRYMMQFNPRYIGEIISLPARPAAYEGGLFMVRLPRHEFFEKVFMGLELQRHLATYLRRNDLGFWQMYRLKDRIQWASPPSSTLSYS